MDRGGGGRPVHRRGGHRQPHRQRRRPRAGPAHPPSQGRLRGRRAGLDRPAHRRRHPAVGLGGRVHRAHRRPPGRGRTPGRRGALRGGGGLAQRGHRPLRRARQRLAPTTRRPAASSATGSTPATATRSSPARPSPSRPTAIPCRAEMFPHAKTLATGESEDDVVIGVTDGSGRRQWLSLSSRLLSGAGQNDVAHGGVLVHRRHRPQGRRGPAPLARLPRLADRARQPLAVQRRARARAAGLHADGAPTWPSSSSTSTGSSWSTTRSATPAATRCCWPWPSGSSRRSAAGDVVSRFSGDEFVVLCRNVHDVERRRQPGRPSTRGCWPSRSSCRPDATVVVTCSVGVSFVDAGSPDRPGHPPAGRRGHVPGQEQGPVAGRGVRRVAPGEVGGPPRDLRRPAPLASTTTSWPSTTSPSPRWHDDRIVAMEALVRWHHPVPRPARADGVHPLRRGDRPHLLARPVGPPRGLPDHGHGGAASCPVPRTPTSRSTSRPTS